jgi:uncharacterized protein DUF2569
MFETKGDSNKIGLGGWLSVWLVLTCLGLIRFIHDIDLHLISNAESLTDPNSEYYHPLAKPLLIFEYILQFVNPLSFIVLIFLYARKSRFFPKTVIVIYAANLVLVLFDTTATMLIAKSVNLTVPFPWKEIYRGLFVVCVWIPYFLKSARVKSTFVK